MKTNTVYGACSLKKLFHKLIKTMFVLLVLEQHCSAADIYFRSDSRWPGMYLEGNIAKGDAEKIRRLWFEKGFGHYLSIPPRTLDLYLDSDGGDVREAFLIGKFVRDASLKVTAPFYANSGHTKAALGDRFGGTEMVCASACAFIWLAGRERNGNSVAFHRPFLANLNGESQSAVELELSASISREMTKSYLTELGVDDRLLSLIMSQSRDEAIWLDDVRKQADISNYSMAFEERLLDTCNWSSRAEDEIYETMYRETDEARLRKQSEELSKGVNCARLQLGKLQAEYWQQSLDKLKSDPASKSSNWLYGLIVVVALILAGARWRWRRIWAK